MDEENEFIELARGVRRVRTPAGARKFGQPIGTIITPDLIAGAKLRGGSKAPSVESRSYARNGTAPSSAGGRPPGSTSDGPNTRTSSGPATTPKANAAQAGGRSGGQPTGARKANPLQGKAKLAPYEPEGPERYQIGDKVYKATRGTEVYRLPGDDSKAFIVDPTNPEKPRLITDRGEIKPNGPEGQRVITAMFNNSRARMQRENSVDSKEFKKTDRPKTTGKTPEAPKTPGKTPEAPKTPRTRRQRGETNDGNGRDTGTARDPETPTTEETDTEPTTRDPEPTPPREPTTPDTPERPRDPETGRDRDDDTPSTETDTGTETDTPSTEVPDTETEEPEELTPETGTPRPPFDEGADPVQNLTGVRVGDEPNTDWIVASRVGATVRVKQGNQEVTWTKGSSDSWYFEGNSHLPYSEAQFVDLRNNTPDADIRVESHGFSDLDNKVDYDGVEISVGGARSSIHLLESTKRQVPWTILKTHENAEIIKNYKQIRRAAKAKYPELRDKPAMLKYLRDNDNFPDYEVTDSDYTRAYKQANGIGGFTAPKPRDPDTPTIRLGEGKRRTTPQGYTTGEFTREEISGAIEILEGYNGKQIKNALKKAGNPLHEINHHELVGFEKDKDASKRKYLAYLKGILGGESTSGTNVDVDAPAVGEKPKAPTPETPKTPDIDPKWTKVPLDRLNVDKKLSEGDHITGHRVKDLPEGSIVKMKTPNGEYTLAKTDGETLSLAGTKSTYAASTFKNTELEITRLSKPSSEEYKGKLDDGSEMSISFGDSVFLPGDDTEYLAGFGYDNGMVSIVPSDGPDTKVRFVKAEELSIGRRVSSNVSKPGALELIKESGNPNDVHGSPVDIGFMETRQAKRILTQVPDYDFSRPAYTSTSSFSPQFEGHIPYLEAREGDSISVPTGSFNPYKIGAPTVSYRVLDVQTGNRGEFEGLVVLPLRRLKGSKSQNPVTITPAYLQRSTVTAADGRAPTGRGLPLLSGPVKTYPVSVSRIDDLKPGDRFQIRTDSPSLPRGDYEVLEATPTGFRVNSMFTTSKPVLSRKKFEALGRLDVERPEDGDVRMSSAFVPKVTDQEMDRGADYGVTIRDFNLERFESDLIESELGSDSVDIDGISLNRTEAVRMEKFLRGRGQTLEGSVRGTSSTRFSNLPASLDTRDWNEDFAGTPSNELQEKLRRALYGDDDDGSRLSLTEERLRGSDRLRTGSTIDAFSVTTVDNRTFTIPGDSSRYYTTGNSTSVIRENANGDVEVVRITDIEGDVVVGPETLRLPEALPMRNFKSGDKILHPAQLEALPSGTKLNLGEDKNALTYVGNGRIYNHETNRVVSIHGLSSRRAKDLTVSSVPESARAKFMEPTREELDEAPVGSIFTDGLAGGFSAYKTEAGWTSSATGKLLDDDTLNRSLGAETSFVKEINARAAGGKVRVESLDEIRAFPDGTILNVKNDEGTNFSVYYDRKTDTFKSAKFDAGSRIYHSESVHDVAYSISQGTATAVIPAPRRSYDDMFKPGTSYSLEETIEKLKSIFPNLDLTGTGTFRSMKERDEYADTLRAFAFQLDQVGPLMSDRVTISYQRPRKKGVLGDALNNSIFMYPASMGRGSIQAEVDSVKGHAYEGWNLSGYDPRIQNSEATAIHEFAHIMDSSMGWNLSGLASAAVAEMVANTVDPGTKLGRYAATNPAETWAELYAQWHTHTNPSEYATRAVELVQDLIRQRPGMEDFTFRRYLERY